MCLTNNEGTQIISNSIECLRECVCVFISVCVCQCLDVCMSLDTRAPKYVTHMCFVECELMEFSDL